MTDLTQGGKSGPWVTGFGADEWSWNLDDPDDATAASDASGLPGVGVVAAALGTWVNLNGRYPTVGEAAMVFNLPPELVRSAVDYSPWMLLGAGDTIELDGA